MDLDTIREYVAEGKISEIIEPINLLEPDQIVDLLNVANSEDRKTLFRLLKPELGIEVLKISDTALAAAILESLSEAEIQYYISHLDPFDAVKIFELFPEELFERILLNLDSDLKTEILLLLGYPENSVGRYLDLSFIALPASSTVKDALEKIRQSDLVEDVDWIFVLTDDGKFFGSVPLRSLVKANPAQRLDSLNVDTTQLQVTSRINEAIDIFSNTSRSILPVVDLNNRLIGVVKAANLLDVAADIQAEKLTAFGGTIEGEVDYRTGTIFEIFKARFVWLLVLVIFGAFVSGYVIIEQDLFTKVTVLAAFLPPIIDMGGNAGSQSASYVIRALAVGQIQPSFFTIISLLKKDFIVALLLGLALAGTELLLSYLSKDVDFSVLLSVALSMVTVVIVGSAVGFLLPFLAVKFKQDPATLSAPVITSLMDLIGAFIYVAYAKLIVL